MGSVQYVDDAGNRYKVKMGINGDFKTFRLQPEKNAKWRSCTQVPWRMHSREAQADLNQLAAANGWQRYYPAIKDDTKTIVSPFTPKPTLGYSCQACDTLKSTVGGNI